MRKFFFFLLSSLLFLFCALSQVIALSSENVFSQDYVPPKNIGVVLSGGGGKGAYEVGVWKAFEEFRLTHKVTVISGTSVGGLNAALFACEPLENVIDIWVNFVPSGLQGEYELINENGLEKIFEEVHLEKLQENPYPKVYVAATRRRFAAVKFLAKKIFDADFSHKFLLNEEKDISEIKKLLLATSAFPILTKAIKLKDGFKYIDGGVCDNTPIEPLLYEENKETLSRIFVVHLDNEERYSKKYPNENVVDIFPSKSLGGFDGMIDFSESTVKKLIELGTQDAMEVFKNNDVHSYSVYWFENHWFDGEEE